jgi:prepilin-type N-terminal cleavage/methylation domain-containing protein
MAGRRAHGYTLIELLITIVVAGILTTVGYQRLSPALVHARVQRAATVVATDLQYAQMLAVRQRQPVAVIVDDALKGYIIRLRDTAVTFRNRYFGTDADYGLDSLGASPATIVLYPSGVAAGTITVGLGLHGYTRQIRMTRGGQVRILP